MGAGRKVSILYRGTLLNGKVFDENQDKSRPFIFRQGIVFAHFVRESMSSMAFAAPKIASSSFIFSVECRIR